MITHKLVVNNLSEYYNVISDIARRSHLEIGCPLWFRGHAYASYNLLPSIMRKEIKNDVLNASGTYSSGNLREDYRLQNYKARVYHLTSSKPSSKLEWQALYQHNSGKTRLMDWSESARTALSFALESFLDPRELLDLKEQRHTITPVVWVLNPKQLNQKVYEYMSDKGNISVHRKALKSLDMQNDAMALCEEIAKLGVCYFQLDALSKDDIEIDGILNLGVVDDYRSTHIGELKELLQTSEFNPFFYMCLRYYVDALPFQLEDINNPILPPLAILHQYQSERIRAQRGVFTIFPNYYLNDKTKNYKRIGYDCRMMENQKYIKDCLYEIRILNPSLVAKELLLSGERRTELYPENEYYVHTLEASKFYI